MMYSKKFLFSALWVVIFFPSLANQRKVDSLETLLSKTKNEKERINLLNSLSEANSQIAPTKSCQYAKEAVELSNITNDSVSLAYSLCLLGDAYRSLSEFEKSLKNLFDALKLFEKFNNKVLEMKCINSIGIVFASIGNLKKAIEYFSRTLSICEELNDTSLMAPALTNLGLLCHQEKDYNKSISYYEKAIVIARKTHNDFGVSLIYINLGMAYCEKGEYLKGLDYFQKAKDMQEQQQDREGVAIALISMGNVYSYFMNQPLKAITFYEEGAKLAKEMNNKRLLQNTYTAMSENYFKLNDYKNAYEYYKLLSAVKDTILNSESSKQITEMQTKYETEKKEKEILLLKKDQEIQQSEAQRQKIIRNSFIGASVLALLLAIVLLNRYQIKKKANQKLTEQNEQIRKQKELIEEQKQNMTDSIEYASYIQHAVLPSDNDFKEAFPDSFIFFRPRDIVNGDFYWMAQCESEKVRGGESENSDILSPSHFLLALGDCTGHGVPGAFMSMLCNALLNEAVNDKGLTAPNEILEDVRKGIISALKQREGGGGSKDGMDCSLISFEFRGSGYGLDNSSLEVNPQLATRNPQLKLALANNPVYIVRRGVPTEIKPDRQPVGFSYNPIPFTTHEIELSARGGPRRIAGQKGDMIYLMSDGYEDQMGGEKEKKFKSKRLKELLVSISDKPTHVQKEILEKTFEEWKGTREQTDDVTVIGIKV